MGRAIKKYVILQLPGDWQISGPHLYQSPVEWLLRYVALGNSRWSSDFSVGRGIELLAVPKEYLGGPHFRTLSEGPGIGIWTAPTTVAEAEPAMLEVLAHIRIEALPLFERFGNLPGYQADAEQRAERQPDDLHFQDEVFCLRLIHGDIDGALRAADAVQRTPQTAPWANDIRTRVAHTADVATRDPEQALQLLRDNVATSKANLRLA